MPRGGGYFYDYADFYPPSRPIEVKGGIKARSQHGAFGKSWWAQRWISVLEGFDIGARIARGRSYARRGQVVGIEIARGMVTAKVQGSRPTPYAVRIRVKPLARADWEHVAEAIAGKAIYTAKLLNGEMPQEIEAAFAEAGVSLFPAHLKEIETSCSCPDWSNPCKHIAAIYFLIGEEFDRDPFLLFTLRGMERGEFLAILGSAAPSSADARLATDLSGAARHDGPNLAAEPLPEIPARFWQGQPLPEGFTGEIQPPLVAAALPRQLGPFPFWRVSRDLREIVEPVYVVASERGIASLAGELPPPVPHAPNADQSPRKLAKRSKR
jgi:uncharacterized Zn finger protein